MIFIAHQMNARNTTLTGVNRISITLASLPKLLLVPLPFTFVASEELSSTPQDRHCRQRKADAPTQEDQR